MPRILQFTDLHMRAALPGHSSHLERRSRQAPALLERLRRRIETENPDLVAFTGDILDVPHDALHGSGDPGFRLRLEEAARADYRTVRAWLESLGRPWLVCPGNHDLPGAFRDVFGDVPQRLQIAGTTALSYYDWEVRDNTAERLGSEAERFRQALDDADADGWTVHLQHYLVHPRVDFGYPMLYRDADGMLARMRGARGRHLSLSGHYHSGTAIEPHGDARFAVCPAFAEAPHPYRVFDLDASGACRMREETLGAPAQPGRRIVCIDRTGLLTEEPAGPSEAFIFSRNISRVFQTLREHALEPVLVSAWNDPQSLAETWPGIAKRHDRAFGSLGDGADQGHAQVICIDTGLPLPGRLPSEPLCTYETLRARVALALAAEAQDVFLVSASADRRSRFGGTGFETVEAALSVLGGTP